MANLELNFSCSSDKMIDSIQLVAFSLRKLLTPLLVSPRNDVKDEKQRQKFCHTDDVSLPTSV